jgi:hypothetical protein
VAEGREWQSEPAALEVGYERLRQAVLGGQPDGFRLGHAVLAARGLVAWMQTVTSVGRSVPTASTSSHPPAGEVVSLPGAEELVAVIAQMALAHAA